ncbi:MAG: carbon storage regulator CsrA [Firmicutes bacterium]|nr:carbon storage regulator CsrA [Bacillota bacterium]
MLILMRKAGQNLIINDNITVKVLEVKGEQVKLGIAAPPEISVHREEVFTAIKAANKAAAITKNTLPDIPRPDKNKRKNVSN